MNGTLTASDVSVLLAGLQHLRDTGDRRYTEEQYSDLDAKLGRLGQAAFDRERTRTWTTESDTYQTLRGGDGMVLGRVERLSVLRAEGFVDRWVPFDANGGRLNEGYGGADAARGRVEQEAVA